MRQKITIKNKLLVRTFLFSILLTGTSTFSNAQFSCGIKLGAGASFQSEILEITDNSDMRFAPTLGFIGKYKFNESIALKTGLEYQHKGRNYEKDGEDIKNKLQYLNLPIKAEFSAGEKAGFKKNQRIYFALGPYLSYLLQAKGELNSKDFDLKNSTKDFDFGLGFEIGFEFPVLNDKALQLGLNYDMGFVEIYEGAAYKDLNNKMVSCSVALLF